MGSIRETVFKVAGLQNTTGLLDVLVLRDDYRQLQHMNACWRYPINC